MSGLIGGGKSYSNVAEKVGGIRIQTSSYGKPIPIIYGTTRVAANLFWYDHFTATSHTEAQSAGKGGGGASTSTTYTYNSDVLFGLCEGSISGIGAVAREKEETTLSAQNMTLFTGARPQSEWSYLTTNYPTKALPYFGTAYVAAQNLELGGDGTLPNFSFEVRGLNIVSGKDDANPADIINDILTNQYYGAGIPSGLMGGLTQIRDYCTAYGILLSPAFISQEAVFDIVKRILQACNSEIVYSEGIVKLIPYGDQTLTANGVTFTPDITPIYDFTDDDYLDLDSPVKVTRSSPSDAFNSVKVEYYDRSNNYNIATDEQQDLANIEMYGYRPKDVLTLHEICDATVAHTIAQLILNRVLYVRNTYEFVVSWRYCLLEPMDIVTITDSTLGFNKLQVRIIEISEDSEYRLTIKAEDFPFGIATASLYPRQSSQATAINYGQTAGNTNPPTIFEAPDQLSKALEIWVGASGSETWGGCDVHVSYDDASYTKIGSITVPTRQGVIVSDTTTSIAVDMSISRSTLAGGTATDMTNNATLCFCNGEFFSYQNATLTSQYHYTLNPLNRPVFDSTTSTHIAGDPVARVESANMIKIPFNDSQIGQKIYIKLPSYNVYGSGYQQLSDISPFVYTIAGDAYQSPLSDVSNLIDYYKSTTIHLKWDASTDFRKPIDYEIRYGASWDGGQVLGRTLNTEFIPQAAGTYWVKAHYLYQPTLLDIYSTNATGITITSANIAKNVVVTYDEKATSWSGTLTGSVSVVSGDLVLSGASGEYEVPTSHIVDIGTAQGCNVSLSYTASGYNAFNLVDSWGFIDDLTDIDGSVGGVWSVTPQIAIADNSGTFGAWRDFYPTDYVGRKFKIKLVLASSDALVYVSVSSLTWSVDVPDRVDTGSNVAIASGGTSITYSRSFQASPNTQITILNATAGDDAVLTAQTATGFTIQIMNGGSGVARNINWLSQGY